MDFLKATKDNKYILKLLNDSAKHSYFIVTVSSLLEYPII